MVDAAVSNTVELNPRVGSSPTPGTNLSMDRLSDYDYFLPESAIAQVPLQDRSASRLLVLNRRTGTVQHKAFRDVVEILLPGDLLVLNDTRVTALRLFGHKSRTSPPNPLSTRVERGNFIQKRTPAVLAVGGGKPLPISAWHSVVGLRTRRHQVASGKARLGAVRCSTVRLFSLAT